MGHEGIKTPHIDKLAEQGALFERGYVPTALCRPSLMNIATGQYSSVTKITGNDPSPAHYAPKEIRPAMIDLIKNIDRFDTIASELTKAGYLTLQTGKWWEGSYQRGGFTHGMTHGEMGKGARHGDEGLKIGREGIKEITDFIDLSIAEKKPFFVWYAPFLPHTPHNPPERLLKKYQDKYDKGAAHYYAMCEWFDETCGDVLNYVKDKGLEDNTLVIYTGDNGWIQRDEAVGVPHLKSKLSPFDGGIRQPIIYKWPAKIKAAKRPELATSLDIFPTIMGAAGIEYKKELPGLNLTPYLSSSQKIPRNKIFGETFDHDIADIDDPDKSLLFRWCIMGDYKLLLSYPGENGRFAVYTERFVKKPQLFNLINDPEEKKDIANQYPEKVEEMIKIMNDWYEPSISYVK